MTHDAYLTSRDMQPRSAGAASPRVGPKQASRKGWSWNRDQLYTRIMGVFSVLYRKMLKRCESSDELWKTFYNATSPKYLMMWPVMHACQLFAIIPPPPLRSPGLRVCVGWFLLLLAMLTCVGEVEVTVARIRFVMARGFQLTRDANIMSLTVVAMESMAALFVGLVQAPRIATLLGKLVRLASSARRSQQASPNYTPCFIVLLALHIAVQVEFGRLKVHTEHPLSRVCLAWGSALGYTVEAVAVLALSLATSVLRDVNRRLESVPATGELGLVLRGALQDWRVTAHLAPALCAGNALGPALAAILLRVRLSFISDSYYFVRVLQRGELSFGHLAACAALALRVAALSSSADGLAREANRTERAAGSLDTTRWTAREQDTARRLLRASKSGLRIQVAGFITLGFGFLLSVIGSTATYLVVLLQYPEPRHIAANVATTATENATRAAPTTPRGP